MRTLFKFISEFACLFVWISPALAALAGLIWGLWNRRRVLREYRIQRGLCPDCGYDLTGNASGVCPECGTPVDY